MGGALRPSGPWLDLASLGLGVLAVALGAWYGVDNWLERERRYAADRWAMRSGPPSSHMLTDLSSPQPGEVEEPTGAEEILAASPGPVVERVLDVSTNLVTRTRRATSGRRWIQPASTAFVLLFLTCLALLLFVPLLLTMVLVYVTDSGHDIRLRIVVVLFVVDIALQVFANV
jgi:hypothetical protein